ncbi:ABC transporter permease [Aquirufa rosea]|uniref:ABC transporter permease n=1 Tax=Aquirufa rosea TaxID=2509241 RepID=A0A4Q1BYB0_9BACT|nr:ABC transporter permease [Aquirufa rosea]RXK47609.1 ABC transporter permease [Aquirufa rosea]
MNWKKIFMGSQSGGIFIALIAVCVLITSLTPRFLTETNLLVILNQVSVNAILAFGVTFVIISGGIDLSLGSMLAVAGVVAALFAKSINGNVYLALIMALGVGALMGALNGLTVILSKVPPFIVTLGTMTIARGVALIISSGRPVSDLLDSFNYLGNGDVLGIPIPIGFLILSYLICHFVLTQTVFGRYVTAIGGNETAAWVAGIPVAKVKWIVYTLSGIFAALGGILLSARINTGQPNAGLGFELDAIAAVIIGGTSTRGGKGSMTGTLLGVLFIGVINNGLDLLNVSAYWQQVVMGGIIILAVILDSVYQKIKR